MATKSKQTFNDLKEEITELKLTDIRKDIIALKEALVSELIGVKEELTETKEHVKTTNGTVAKVTEQAFKLELQYKNHQEDDKRHWDRVDKMDEDTKTIRWLMNHPKVLGSIIALPFLFLSVKGVEGIIEVISKLITYIKI